MMDIMEPMDRSTLPSERGLYGEINLWSIPMSLTNARMTSLTNSDPLSDWMIFGTPNIANICQSSIAISSPVFDFNGRST